MNMAEKPEIKIANKRRFRVSAGLQIRPHNTKATTNSVQYSPRPNSRMPTTQQSRSKYSKCYYRTSLSSATKTKESQTIQIRKLGNFDPFLHRRNIRRTRQTVHQHPKYPTFKLVHSVVVSCGARVYPCNEALISAQGLATDEGTMMPKERRARDVTELPNQRTLPSAMRMIVRFLKIA